MKSNTDVSANFLLESLKGEKNRLISRKQILEKNDKHAYPLKNVPFEIPSSWVWCYLSDISLIQEGPGIRKHQYSDGGIQFLTVTNILEGSVDLKKSQKYISTDQYVSYAHFTVNKGDIVTACSGGSWGKSAIYNLDDKVILNTSTLRLRFFGDLGDNRYLYYLTKTKYFKESLSSHVTGQQPNYGYSHYSKIPIPLPSLLEQQRIVSILDLAFAAISKAKANTEKNLQNAKELFESYLQAVFANPGEDWEEKRLVDICDLITDGTHFSPKNISQGDYKYVTAKNIKPYYIDLSKISYISTKDHKEIYSRCPVKRGDVLYIKDGATAGIATINSLDEEFSLLSSVALIKPSALLLSNTFLVHYMNSSLGKKNFLGYIDGAAITRLTLIKIKNVTIPVPPIDQQNFLVNKLDALSAETKKLETIYLQKLNALEELKKSILQKAFSGELKTKEEVAV